jgi:hypothetical protein
MNPLTPGTILTTDKHGECADRHVYRIEPLRDLPRDHAAHVAAAEAKRARRAAKHREQCAS